MRVLVTHGLGFLPQCDKIVVMDNGSITEVGTYTELVERDGAFAKFLQNYATRNDSKEGSPGKIYMYHCTHCTHTIVPTPLYPYHSAYIVALIPLFVSVVANEEGVLPDNTLPDDTESKGHREVAHSHDAKGNDDDTGTLTHSLTHSQMLIIFLF